MRIGIDLGGTKIEGIVLSPDGGQVERQRVATPPGDYASVLAAVSGLVGQLDRAAGGGASVGIGTPGFLSPRTGRIRNSNLAALNGQAVDRDLADQLGRPVRLDNDANCFVLSEVTDGAAAPGAPSGGMDVVFGATLGTGVGGGIVVDGRVMSGANGAGAEWSHTTLPFLEADERSPYVCFCGRPSCIESFVSGRGLAGAYQQLTAKTATGAEVGRLAAAGDLAASQAFDVYEGRLARALAGVINLLDPRAIVLGGGVSNNARLFENLPRLWQPYNVADDLRTTLVRARHGDASGVRGAACLWPAR